MIAIGNQVVGDILLGNNPHTLYRTKISERQDSPLGPRPQIARSAEETPQSLLCNGCGWTSSGSHIQGTEVRLPKSASNPSSDLTSQGPNNGSLKQEISKVECPNAVVYFLEPRLPLWNRARRVG